jgi:hypothetical protein
MVVQRNGEEFDVGDAFTSFDKYILNLFENEIDRIFRLRRIKEALFKGGLASDGRDVAHHLSTSLDCFQVPPVKLSC